MIIGMKKSIYILFLAVPLLACESDFLDRPPLDAIGESEYWRTAKDLENYVSQYYPTLPTHGIWSLGMPLEESNSDNLIVASPNLVLNGKRGTTGGRWVNDWATIRSVNIFFDNYRKCQDDFDVYKHFLGEAYFFRAWFYFQLIDKYGDVPWYSKQLLPGSEDELARPRDPRTVVVDSVLADLDKAVQYLDKRSKAGNNRINKEAALAFKTRIALFEGTWQKYHAGTAFGTANAQPGKYFQIVLDAAEELMNGDYTRGLYNTGKPDKDYYTLFGLDNMSAVNEILFYRAYNIGEGMGNDIQYNTTYATSGMGATWSLVSSYLSKDGTPYDYPGLASAVKGNDFLTKIANDVDPRLHATIWIPGDLEVAQSGLVFARPGIDEVEILLNPTGFEVKKFSNPNSSGAGKGGGGNSETGYILFRYGEVLLNYAEAKYELEQVVTYDVLNLLRERAGMPAFSINPQGSDPNLLDYGYPISDELYEIRRERRVELALEGKRSADYRRWAAHTLFQHKRPKGYPFNASEFPEYNPPLDDNGLIDYFANELPDGYSFRENQDYLDAIPVEELTLNENLEQNPGW